MQSRGSRDVDHAKRCTCAPSTRWASGMAPGAFAATLLTLHIACCASISHVRCVACLQVFPPAGSSAARRRSPTRRFGSSAARRFNSSTLGGITARRLDGSTAQQCDEPCVVRRDADGATARQPRQPSRCSSGVDDGGATSAAVAWRRGGGAEADTRRRRGRGWQGPGWGWKRQRQRQRFFEPAPYSISVQ